MEEGTVELRCKSILLKSVEKFRKGDIPITCYLYSLLSLSDKTLRVDSSLKRFQIQSSYFSNCVWMILSPFLKETLNSFSTKIIETGFIVVSTDISET